MPTTAVAGAVPTRSQIDEWTTTHLADAAANWRTAATTSEELFDRHRSNIASPGGTTWEGDAKDAALDRATADTAIVHRHSQTIRAAATIAENGAHDITAAHREALAAITTAENDGFRVAEDLTLTDTRKIDLDNVAARRAAATEHAEDIRWYAERLTQTDTFIGHRLESKAAELEGIRFDDEDEARDHDREGTVHLVDNTIKLNPQDDDPWAPHPDYPGRTRNGKYGEGNSGDGDAAANAALDQRESETHIPLVRQEVRATHPDVRHPDGTPQFRYYDALEPTGNPDEYIGIEAKANPKALRRDQQAFDAAVTPDRPATARLDGRDITIVDSVVTYPPEGWVDPTRTPEQGAGGFGGAHAEGTVPVAPAPTNTPQQLPGWGTQLTPQQMVNSDDPALRVAGQAILEQMQREGRIDPGSTA